MLAPALPAPLVPPVTFCDVLVAGAGPAGSIAAREIARSGARVTLLDRSAFPRRKVCGGCLSAGALEVLDTVGLGDLPDGLGARPLDALVLSAGGRRATLRLVGGSALSRHALDAALVEAARAAGAAWWPGARARLGELRGGCRTVHVDDATGSHPVLARVVVDATGLGAPLDRDARQPPRDGSRLGVGALFEGRRYGVEDGILHMVVGRSGYVGLVRLESGDLNVAAAIDQDALRGSSPAEAVGEILASAGWPRLEELPAREWRGTPLMTRNVEDVVRDRVLRLGDAAGYVEPFTGEGMCWGMSAAVAVAPLAIAGADDWTPQVATAWRRYHRESLSRARRLSRVLSPLLRHPRLVSAAVAGLSIVPSLARPFVRVAARAPEPLVAAP